MAELRSVGGYFFDVFATISPLMVSQVVYDTIFFVINGPSTMRSRLGHP